MKKAEEQQLQIVVNPEISKWRSQTGPDKGLTEDIKNRGLIQNMTFRRLPDGKLELIAGNRRFRSMQAGGIPITEKDMKILDNVSDVDAYLMALAENEEREAMTPLEEGRAYKTLQKTGMAIDEIAIRVKASETFVRERLGLLDLPDKVQEMMMEGKVPMKYHKALGLLRGHPDAQIVLANQIAKQDYNVRTPDEAEELAQRYLQRLKHTADLLRKYGPCPKCGSDQITDEDHSWDKGKLTCRKCGFEFNAETKEPWEITKVREQLKKIGIDVKLGEGEAVLTPEDITKAVAEHEKAMMKTKAKPNFRSFHTLAELLAPFLNNENLLSIRVLGDHIEIRLVEDSKINFTTRRHSYETGEKCLIHTTKAWDEENEDFDVQVERVHKFEQALKLD